MFHQAIDKLNCLGALVHQSIFTHLLLVLVVVLHRSIFTCLMLVCGLMPSYIIFAGSLLFFCIKPRHTIFTWFLLVLVACFTRLYLQVCSWFRGYASPVYIYKSAAGLGVTHHQFIFTSLQLV